MRIKAIVFLSEVRRLVFLGLLLVSAAIIVMPQCRIGSTVVVQRALLTVACIWTTYRALRLGYLSKTHAEAVSGIVNGELPRSLSAFEMLSLGAGFIATMVLAFN